MNERVFSLPTHPPLDYFLVAHHLVAIVTFPTCVYYNCGLVLLLASMSWGEITTPSFAAHWLVKHAG